jgi:hypothetical protein
MAYLQEFPGLPWLGTGIESEFLCMSNPIRVTRELY